MLRFFGFLLFKKQKKTIPLYSHFSWTIVMSLLHDKIKLPWKLSFQFLHFLTSQKLLWFDFSPYSATKMSLAKDTSCSSNPGILFSDDLSHAPEIWLAILPTLNFSPLLPQNHSAVLLLLCCSFSVLFKYFSSVHALNIAIPLQSMFYALLTLHSLPEQALLLIWLQLWYRCWWFSNQYLQLRLLSWTLGPHSYCLLNICSGMAHTCLKFNLSKTSSL